MTRTLTRVTRTVEFKPALSGRLDGIAQRLGPDNFSFASALGSTTWRRTALPGSHMWTYEVIATTGFNLLDDGRADVFVGLASERSGYDSRPLAVTDHSRPYGYDSLSQLFDDPKVPDVLAIPAPGFPLHGNVGNHGSLASVQARGLFIAGGPGFTHDGWVPTNGRVIDVAPTVLAALGAPVVGGIGPNGARRSARLLQQDGNEIGAVLDRSTTARRLVCVVFDGCNTNLLVDALVNKELPNIAWLMERGTGLRHGIVSSFPTVTLPNHYSAFTGVHPGRHGIVNNEFLGFGGEHVNLLDLECMPHAYRWLTPGVETLHDAVHRWQPHAFTSACFEYADRGANWSTFDEYRTRGRVDLPSGSDARSFASDEAFDDPRLASGYDFMTRVDEHAIRSAIAQWSPDSGHSLPTLQLVSLSLTDQSGHAVGPLGDNARVGLIDSDRRLGRLLQAITHADALEETGIIVLSDHGMDQCDPLFADHPLADLSAHWAALGLREIGDALIYPICP